MCGLEQVGNAAYGMTLMIVLKHESATGVLELSTAYSWATATEQMTINTREGTYEMSQMERLDFCPKMGSLCGVCHLKSYCIGGKRLLACWPATNLLPSGQTTKYIHRDFYGEIKAFTDAVEGRNANISSSLESLVPTYELLECIRRKIG